METITQPKYYNATMKKAIQKYRQNNLEKYNEYHRDYYHTHKENTEWKDNYLAKCREANRKYREKKKLENPLPITRGRPKKAIPFADDYEPIVELPETE